MDLVCLVADSNMEAAVSALLDRHQALGIRPIERLIKVHRERDSGCYHRPADVLRAYRRDAEHAVVMLDHAWDGVPARSGSGLERLIDEKLRLVGMGGWAVPVVIEPELETWVFSSSPHVSDVLGWKKRKPNLRKALEQQGLWSPEDSKPDDPKAALKWALKVGRNRPISSVYFRRIAQRVSVENCQDRSFLRFKNLLQHWFPLNPVDGREEYRVQA